MTDQSIKSDLNREIYQGIRQRERLAWIIALLSGLGTLMAIGAILIMLPLKETKAYLGLVDQNTGNVVRAYEVGRASVSDQDAVIESWIYNYVIGRETHDMHDQQQRLEGVIQLSTGNARADLLNLWKPGSKNYIRNTLDKSARVYVKVNAITLLDNNTAQVRIEKRLIEGNREGRSNYIVTLSYRFNPVNNATNQLVWENPFGFQVTDYRIDFQSEG